MTVVAALLLGAVIGISLGALGGGGSILTVPALVYALGESARAATAASLVIVGITSIVSAIGHARAGHVRWRAGSVFGLVGVAASYGGTALNRHVDSNVLLLAFAALMLVAAAAMLRRAPSKEPARAPAEPDREREPARASAPGPDRPVGPVDASGTEAAVGTTAPGADRAGSAAKVVVAGLVVGFLTGFLGVGGGFVIVPALVMALGFAMPAAVGTSLLVIALNCAVALAARAGHESFDWALIVPFTAAAVVASLAGGRVAGRVAAGTLVRAFAALLIAIALYTAIRSGLALA